MILFPGHREHESLASHHIVTVAVGADAEEDGIPVAIGSFHQIGMTDAGNRVGTVARQAALRQYRIDGTRFERAERRRRGEDHFRVVGACSTFGSHQVVCAVDVVEVWTFYPAGMLGFVYAPVNNHLLFSYGTTVFPVKFAYPDSAVTVIFGLSCRTVIVHNVCFPVFVEEKSGVDAAHFGQESGITPVSFLRIIRGDEEVAATVYGCSDQIEQSVVRIVFDVRSIDTATDAQAVVHRQL